MLISPISDALVSRQASLLPGSRSAATTGIRAGVDLLRMSKRLGHSSVSVTGNIYAHFIEELDQEAAEKTAGLLLPRAASD